MGMEQTSSWIKNPVKYHAYVTRTNEKDLLKTMLAAAFQRGELPVRPGDHGKRILDLGCGIGALTGFLAELFKGNDIYAIERSHKFLAYAEQHVINPGNIRFYAQHFEDFAALDFDFILCSHVLQYIDSPIDDFLLLLRNSLKADGECWIILQEDAGINQIVRAVTPYLHKVNPYFARWFVHDHVRRRLSASNIPFKTSTFVSYFRAPDFKEPKGCDRQCLDFVLLDAFEEDNQEFRQSLAALGDKLVVNGRVRHEVGVTRIRR